MKYTTPQVSKLPFTAVAFGILLSAVALPNQAQAAPGDLDLTFSTDGKVTTDFSGDSDIGNAVAVQPDGKIVLAGFTRGDTATDDFALARYNVDGSLDSTFGTGGKVETDFFSSVDRVNAIAIQADGKIIAAGFTDTFFGLIRYNTNGTIDTSFGVFGDGKVRQPVAGGGSAQVNAVAIQSDGKIVVAGRAGDQVANTLDFAILQFNTDGTLDTSFGTGGGTNVDFFAGNDAVFALVIQADGKIVAAGSASRGDATSPDFALVRLNADGSFNTTFGTGGKVTTDFSASLDGIYGLALQTDGKIVAAGFTFIESEANDNFALARYLSDGTLDPAFGTGGKVITDIHPVTDEAHAVVVESDGHIIAGGIAGPFGNLDFALARYDSDGSLDSSFGADGIVTTVFTSSDDVINGLALQADGKLVAAGLSGSGSAFALARYLTVETTATSRLLNIATRLNVLTGGNVLIGGFIITGDDPKKVIVRAIGPSLALGGSDGVLADPVLELHQPDGTVVTNDNWRDMQEQEIIDSTIPPANELESAIVATLEPGAYTAIVLGQNGGTGLALVETYDLDQGAASQLANISTRGFVDTGNNVMIGGFILGGGDESARTVVVRGIGPSLADVGVTNPLQDPMLELYNGDGDLIVSNDDWKDSQQSAIEDAGLAPGDERESAIEATLAAGSYTAILRGKNNTTGVGLVEAYNLL
ncbi:MAG: delta-60 repeat domain-containing protein [Verrucomicrobiota bacterium]|nr:delta-60 repeat domain-containing protein [Verrucomicrobiota bacterium]